VKSLGGKVVAGGVRMEGSFYQPTVIHSLPVEGKVSSQEIFGPVVCVYPYDTFDEALNAVNIHPHAFLASVMSQ
jgi:acyl-CoA reductase-like NAD-dependent aldehyde dehydrogenase